MAPKMRNKNGNTSIFSKNTLKIVDVIDICVKSSHVNKNEKCYILKRNMSNNSK